MIALNKIRNFLTQKSWYIPLPIAIACLVMHWFYIENATLEFLGVTGLMMTAYFWWLDEKKDIEKIIKKSKAK